VLTDFILSVEIVIIALGTVLEEQLTIQILTVVVVALLATVGVYGIVALIVRMDDAGYSLIKSSGDKGFLSTLGHLLVKALPIIIRILAVVGTIALIMVAGGIFVHNIEYVHHLYPKVPSTLKELAYGLIGGLIAVAVITGTKKLISAFK
jgi:predicted DNA repair protein MutK